MTAMLLAAMPEPVFAAAGPASLSQQLARVQLHRSGNRGQAYLPRARADGSNEPSEFSLRTVGAFAIDGDGTANVRANVYPIDAVGGGGFELVQFNGYRFMRVYTTGGRKLWQITNGGGRVHRDAWHRDTAAILDVNGDGRQDIVHCWVSDGRKVLVARRGDTGAVLRSVVLSGEGTDTECQIAAFKVAGRGAPIILVAHTNRACARPTLDNFARVVAFDTSLNRLWERSTCDAGHYAWPLDSNGDGAAEGIFVGKYLLTPSGGLRCTLAGWGGDHVDSLAVADFDPTRPGLEVAATGLTGMRIHQAESCGQIARVGAVRNGQHLAAARLAGSSAPVVFVRGRDGNSSVWVVNGRGQVQSSFRDGSSRILAPSINANLDGAAAAEDMVAWFGQVIDRVGRLRLSTAWYWSRQSLGAGERSLSPFDVWTSAPVIVDLDGDGRDEMITWGRHAMVIGKR